MTDTSHPQQHPHIGDVVEAMWQILIDWFSNVSIPAKVIIELTTQLF